MNIIIQPSADDKTIFGDKVDNTSVRSYHNACVIPTTETLYLTFKLLPKHDLALFFLFFSELSPQEDASACQNDIGASHIIFLEERCAHNYVRVFSQELRLGKVVIHNGSAVFDSPKRIR